MPLDQGSFVLPAVEADEVLRVLTKGRALLSDPARWMRGDYCADNQYCSLGALGCRANVTRDDPTTSAAIQALNSVLPRGGFTVALFNDDPKTTHADILALFDRAIAARRAEIGG